MNSLSAADDDVDYVIGCQGKETFANPATAHRVVKRRNQIRRAKNQVYRCKHCGQWHLGTRAGVKV